MRGVRTDEVPSYQQVEDGNAFKQQLIHLSVKVAQASDQLPESIFIGGVKLLDKSPVGAGGHADIYYGDYDGQLVAVKKLRASATETAETRAKRSRVMSFTPS